MTDFDVRARLTLTTKDGRKEIDKLAGRLKSLGAGMRGTESSFARIGTSIAGMAVGYVGVSAIANGFRAMVSSAAEFESAMQGTQIGLASIMQQVEQVSFAQATDYAAGSFQRLTDMAITSTASTKEMFDIFSGIYGPIRAAGQGMETVYEMTKNTTLAASALDIDFQQARRDIGAMVRGSAGLDVKLFSSLRSMGLITENAEAFNKLTQADRVNKLREALSGFGEAGEAYAASLPGVTSTFTDIFQQLRRVAFKPVFDVLGKALGKLNDKLIANKEQIGAYLQHYGELAAKWVGFALMRAQKGLDYVAAHWDEIVQKVDLAVNKFRQMIPALKQAGTAFAAFSVGKQALGALISFAGTIAGLGSALSGMGAGAAATAGAGGAAAAGGGVATGGLVAGFEAIVAMLTPLLAPLAIVAAVVGSVLAFVVDQWDALVAALAPFMPVFESLFKALMDLGAALMDILSPILKLLGGLILLVVVPPILLLVKVLEMVVRVITWVAEMIASVMQELEALMEPIFDWIVWMIANTAAWLGSANVSTAIGKRGKAVGVEAAADAAAGSAIPGDAPPERNTTVNDFRGSKISIKQEFRDADPDRIAVQMAEDLRKYAEYRVTSGFASPLSR